jgi:hypothetical protein
MSDFLPTNYEVPNKTGNYMKFQDGENRFRILGSPILGWETWKDLPEGGRKPIRTTMDKPFGVDEIEDGDPTNVKHFWAMPVWNYKEERIQVLEITQKGIQKTLRALAKDVDWGSPTSYDIVVTKTGQKLETEYSVSPKPAKKLDAGITKLFEDMQINLPALFIGGDPFAGDTVDPDEADKAISEGRT